ncbi:DNA mismatch repair protein MutL [Candidatus Regiella insecticola]|uniref:DNA mismatch repair protein MutL n=1 Tax=Candidatus Regiella insecticola TaxID=138073 RepID=A0A6L2ZPU0_9ENTR|nr:DNA mismatch repair endonuclease MutL [Candidatus Regiella insecticola]GFN46562.1 DNA mismatch repair protein MutL [Candidatus Regiella insecticola]
MLIKMLPPQITNQIAAGEVVERPASVVKELLENSLDAGAKWIDINIKGGGSKLIRIQDNGTGIAKDDLPLALARHATSKISALDDLMTIRSMGFRGEALASISSVSRLLLTSRTVEQTEAWQSYAEGRDMLVKIKPAAHPVGSTLEVFDLFYNTPARRKFMRTEKTEFAHIDEVVRRIALARFDVTIHLHHNEKLIRQYRAVSEPAQYSQRLASVCGNVFLQHMLAISWQHEDLAIHGWLADPQMLHNARSLNEIQYCYVNNRVIRDRLINHAIRQAYQGLSKDGQQIAYVLYLTIEPSQVDINVHPAKHEVRFHQARLVHDFIYQAVTMALQDKGLQPASIPAGNGDTESKSPHRQPETRVAAGINKYAPPSKPCHQYNAANSPREYFSRQGELYGQLLQSTTPSNTATVKYKSPQAACSSLDAYGSNSFGPVLGIFPPCYALIQRSDEKIALLALSVAERCLKQAQLTPPREGLRAQPLLIPLKLNLDKAEITAGKYHKDLLSTMGIELLFEQNRATLRTVCLPLRQQNLQKLIPELLSYLSQHEKIAPEKLAAWISQHLGSEHEQWSVSQAIQLLTDVERLCPHLVQSPPARLLQFIDIQAPLAILIHEKN